MTDRYSQDVPKLSNIPQRTIVATEALKAKPPCAPDCARTQFLRLPPPVMISTVQDLDPTLMSSFSGRTVQILNVQVEVYGPFHGHLETQNNNSNRSSYCHLLAPLSSRRRRFHKSSHLQIDLQLRRTHATLHDELKFRFS